MARIIDADGHILEPPSVWQEYTEPAYRDGVIQIFRDQDGIDKLKINGEIRCRDGQPPISRFIDHDIPPGRCVPGR